MVCWEAIEHYQAALSLDPGHRAARTGLADLLAQAGAWVEAEEILAGAPSENGEGADASVDPMKPGLRNGRAEALFAGRRS
jgi:thioredoxin-like negative regulator of GroEL